MSKKNVILSAAKNRALAVSLVALLLLAAAVVFYIWRDLKTPVEPIAQEIQTDVRLEETRSETEEKGAKESVGDPPPPSPSSKPAFVLPVPDLNRALVVTAPLTTEVKKAVLEKIEFVRERLKDNSDLYSHWLELGLQLRAIGDYEGARQAWEYAGKIRPQEPVSFHNLGDLYLRDLNDLKKAEENYKKALALDPRQVIFYEKLYEFYRYHLKDEVKAREVLEKGIAANPPGVERLKEFLASF